MHSKQNICFVFEILQQELNEVAESWNTHYIHMSCLDTVPGIPNEFYKMHSNPEMHAFQDCKKDIDEQKKQKVVSHLLQIQTDESDELMVVFSLILTMLHLFWECFTLKADKIVC